jgi:hypothetical protein
MLFLMMMLLLLLLLLLILMCYLYSSLVDARERDANVWWHGGVSSLYILSLDMVLDDDVALVGVALVVC